MTEYYVSDAVKALGDFYEANLQSQLTAVETASGLSAGDLPAPDAYVQGFIPRHPASPLLMIFDEGFQPVEQRSGMWLCECTAALAFNGNADIASDMVKLRRYATALLWTVLKNPTLSSGVVGCHFAGAQREGRLLGESATRHTYYLDWDVLVWAEV